MLIRIVGKERHTGSLSLSDVREPAAGVLASQLIFNFHSQDKRYPTEKEEKKEEEVNDMSVRLLDALHTGRHYFLDARNPENMFNSIK
jgi:hypothetical protein